MCIDGCKYTVLLSGCDGSTPVKAPLTNSTSETSQGSSGQNSSEAAAPAQSTSGQAAAQTSQPPQEQAKKIEFETIPSEVVAETSLYRNDMGLFGYSEKYGYFGPDGKVVIDAKYKYANAFYSDYAIASKSDESMYIIDKQGKETPLSTDYVYLPSGGGAMQSPIENVFIDGAAVVPLNERKLPSLKHGYAVIDTSGKELFREADYCSYMGMVKGDYIFYNFSNFNRNCDAVVYDKSGKQVSSFSFTTTESTDLSYLVDYKDGLIPAAKNTDGSTLCGIIDITSGKTVIDYTFEALKTPSEGMIAFKKYGKWGFIDYTGKVVVEPTYEEAYTFSKGLCPVKAGGLIGFVDNENKMVIEPQYDPKYVNYVNFFKFNDDGIALISQVPATFIDRAGNEHKLDGAGFDYNIEESTISVYKNKTSTIYKLKK